FGVAVLAVERDGKTVVSPQPDHVMLDGDYIVLSARDDDMHRLCGVYGLDLQDRVRLGANALRTEGLSMAELVLMPRSDLIGRTLAEVDFRDTCGVGVLGIWRDGHPLRTRLAQIQIQSGDALLVQGSQTALHKLRESPDFVVLTEETNVPARRNRAPLAIAILLSFVVALVLQLAPVAIVGIAAAVAMVVTGCVTMDEARRAVQWRAILLISAMLSLAEAMVGTGTVSFLAGWATGGRGTLGVLPVLASVLVLAFLFTHVMGNHVTVVLMAPLAIDAAVRMGADPRMFALGVALAATSGFASPYAHPGNLLVMGPGNYRFGDFFRLGLVVGLLTLTASFTMLVLIYGR
ncbi:MAG: SLC13 family permease, partial [Pirellulaceae bacterium]|nr:SLC13 family permease [Pirellulaceae bacterium]